MGVTFVLLIAGLMVAQVMPSCRAFDRRVEKEARERLRTLYMGEGDPNEVDRAYIPQGSSYREIIDQLREQAWFEFREQRPFPCL